MPFLNHMNSLQTRSDFDAEFTKRTLEFVTSHARCLAPDEKDTASQNSIRKLATKGEERFLVLVPSQIALFFDSVAMVSAAVSATASLRCCCSSSVVSTSSASSSSISRVDMGRRGFLGALIAAAAAAGVGGAAAAVAEEMPAPEIGLQEGRIRGCDGRPPCVSTSAFQSPSRFMPPWTYLGTQEDAYVALKSALARMVREHKW